MNKFKIGDKVKIKPGAVEMSSLHADTMHAYEGRVGTIEYIGENDCFEVFGCFWEEIALEAVDPCEGDAKQETPRGDWREWILTTARNAVCTDRNKKYGEPENSFAAIAKLWTAYLQASGKMDEDINIYDNDAALMLAMFKIAREITAISPNPDSYADIAGYAACAGECALNGDGQTL